MRKHYNVHLIQLLLLNVLQNLAIFYSKYAYNFIKTHLKEYFILFVLIGKKWAYNCILLISFFSQEREERERTHKTIENTWQQFGKRLNNYLVVEYHDRFRPKRLTFLDFSPFHHPQQQSNLYQQAKREHENARIAFVIKEKLLTLLGEKLSGKGHSQKMKVACGN